jgi:L-threonylcarbamoyladenylate synthase
MPDRMTERIETSDPTALPRALEVLQAGNLVGFPTDTVYGLGAAAYDDMAVGRLYETKGRGTEKAIPILLGDASDLSRVALDPSEMALALATRFWPGALTLVVVRQPGLPESLSQDATIGVRVPDHPFARQLLRAAGPLAATSANRTGEASPLTAEDVLRGLGGRFELLLDGGTVPGGRPSTVIDCTGKTPRLLRPGPISYDEIRATLGLG